MKQKISGIILAGGKSERMGFDKGQAIYKQTPLIEYTIGLLKSYCNDIIISTNEPSLYSRYGFPLVADEHINSGPMGGIHASLKNSTYELNLILACDMPDITQQVIDHLISRCSNNQIIVPTLNGRPEPLCAIYPRFIYQQLEQSLTEGRFKMQDFLRSTQTCYVPMECFMEESGNIFKNVNSPADLIC